MKIKKFTSILLSALMISAVSVGVTAKEISSKDYEKPNSAVIPTETVVEETTNDKGETSDVTYKGGIDVGTKSGDYTSLNWGKSYQTDNISLEGYAPDESSVFPEGIDSFNNLVYIIDTDDTSINDKNGSVIFGGGWYYLHADGNWDDKAGS